MADSPGFSSPVQQAVYDRLSAAAQPGVPVFTVVPDNTKPPCVVIADSQIEEIGSKTRSCEQHIVTVRTFFPGTSKAPLLSAMSNTKRALHDQPMVATGFLLSDCRFLSAVERRDLDEAVLVGEQNFLIIAQAE